MSLVLADEVVKAGVLQREVAESERRWRSMLENVELVVIGLDSQGRVNYTNPFFSRVTGFSAGEVNGRYFFDALIPPHMQAEMWGVFSDFLDADTNRYYQNSIVTKDGAECIISWANVRLRDNENQVIGTLSIGNDITDRTRTEKELERYREQLEELVEARTFELTRVVTELNTLNQIAQSVAAFTDLQDTLQGVCEMVSPLFNAAVVVVNVFDLEKETVNLLAGYDRDVEGGQAAGVGQTLPLAATSMMQQVSRTGQPFNAAGLLSQEQAVSPLLAERHIDALLIEPLRSRGEIIGVLGILRDKPAAGFDEADNILAETIAGYIAAAIENTQLSQQLADTAVSEERNRIARELHDSVTQNLYTVATISDTIPDIWETHPEETHKALDNLRRLSRGALAEMRILLLELRPSSLLEKSLGQLLQQLGEGVEGRSRIQITTSIVGDQVFPDDVQIALYRISQEALNNVIKHSEATQATIGLYCMPDQVTLGMRDNGRGFDMETMDYGGFGLENMQERARQIDAKLDIKSEINNGTEMNEPKTPIRVLAVDDHELLRDGIRLSLLKEVDIELVAEARSGEDALHKCDQLIPDVVLMDMQLPHMDGIAATRAIKEAHPSIQVLVLTSFVEKELVQGAIQAGAIGYLTKGANKTEIAEAIRAAYAGETALSPEATQALIQATKAPKNPGTDLTKRQREVLKLMVAGLNNNEIGEQLFLSPSTVSYHVSEILSKLGASNRAEAAALAVQYHLVEP